MENRSKINQKDRKALELLEKDTGKKFELSPYKAHTSSSQSGYDINEMGFINFLEISGNGDFNTLDLSNFKELKFLTISNAYLDNYSFIKNYTQLSSLLIADNSLSDISFLKFLKNNLEKLCLDSNKIEDFSILKDLKKLSDLVIVNTVGFNDFSFIKYLNQLKSLCLGNTQISDISFLKDLRQLTSLSLRNNQISDISILKDLRQLTSLMLPDNQISDISALKDLKQLTELNLSRNLIEIVPKEICNLNAEFVREGASQKGIILYGNPIKSPPIEIVLQGKKATINWFAANKKELCEIKVLLLGDAEAGKTSLLKRLKSNEYKKGEEPTDGIIIEEMDFEKLPTFVKQKKLHGTKAYFWDFGGQEIMTSTHQFFMTKRSVYILLLEARNDGESERQVRNWLKRIRTFGGNSQVIVVVNKIDLNPAFGLDTYKLQKDFPQIKGFVNISCETGKNINKLKELLEEFIPKAELFKTEIDERWIDIKDDLQKETKKESYVSHKNFTKICIKHKLKSKEEQNEAILFLNDLGIVLHFDELDLGEYFILDPLWVTNGVYKILTSDLAAKQKGEIKIEQLPFIVNEEIKKTDVGKPTNINRIQYSPQELRFLADIMAQFKLSFYQENKQIVLIPDLLNKHTPAKLSESFSKNPEKLCFNFKYDYLPNSIIPRFMVEMKKDIAEKWRSGVILKCQTCLETEAIISSTENWIKIIVTGKHKQKREYLSIIRFFLENINSDFNVTITPFVPLPGFENNFVKYNQLLKMEKAGEKKYYDWDIEEVFEISRLLEGIADNEEIRKRAEVINEDYEDKEIQKDMKPEVKKDKKIELKTIELFLASSKELKVDREQVEIWIGRENKRLVKKGIFLNLNIWEDFLDAMSRTGLQKEYNKTVEKSDIFISMFATKVGKFTEEEFDVAYENFLKKGKNKFIYTFFKDVQVNISEINIKDLNNLNKFKKKLDKLGHYYTPYKSTDDLLRQLKVQLDKMKIF